MEQLDEIEQSIIGLLTEVEAIRRRSRSGVRCFGELIPSDSWQRFTDWTIYSFGLSANGVEQIRVSTPGSEIYRGGVTVLTMWLLWRGSADDRSKV